MPPGKGLHTVSTTNRQMTSESVYIVCGGGNGLGEAVAIELGRQGATVVVNDLGTDVSGGGASEAPAEKTAEKVRAAGGEARSHFGDVSSLSYTEELVSDVADEYGEINGVANFAGISDGDRLVDMSADAWDRVVRVHLRGHFTLLKSAGTYWQDSHEDNDQPAHRSFLGVTSRAITGTAGNANYSAAKAGILGLIRTAAKELAEHDVRVNAVMPTAYTRMLERFPDEELTPVQRQPPEKVAPIAAFLLSEKARGITGTTVRASGDTVGLISEPTVDKMAVREGGWTIDSLADRFQGSMESGFQDSIDSGLSSDGSASR
jgi:NAD(P)-dependent dehydrogenase (short-subunit alcohol dehydrogenase family)